MTFVGMLEKHLLFSKFGSIPTNFSALFGLSGFRQINLPRIEKFGLDIRDFISISAPLGSFYCTFFYSPGGKFQMPEDYLALDGNSLSTDDLRQLGKGRYKIRITKGLSMSNYPKFYLIYIKNQRVLDYCPKS